jgi:hypothetical protein
MRPTHGSGITASGTRSRRSHDIDVFYADLDNRPVATIMALAWVRQKATGATEAKLKEYAIKLRDTA